MKTINNDIVEARVGFPNAKLLKEKGFSVPTESSYTLYLKTNKSDNPSFRTKKGELEISSGYTINNHPSDLSNKNYVKYSRPTQQVVIDWIRLNFDIHISILSKKSLDWQSVYHIELDFIYPKEDIDIDTPDAKYYKLPNSFKNEFNTPEEAKEAAINYVLPHVRIIQ